jgi:hypothetical protein
MGKMFQNASSLKPLGQFKPNCPGMIIGRSSTKFLFFMPIGNPRGGHLEFPIDTKKKQIFYRSTSVAVKWVVHLSFCFEKTSSS